MGIYKRATLGAEAGLLAGAGVILLFLVPDLVHLAPFSTPGALSTSLFGPGDFQWDTGLLAQAGATVVYGARLLTYTLLHFLVFGVLGIGAAFALRGTSWLASLAGGALYGVTVCSGAFYGSRFLLDHPVTMDDVGLPSILVANAVAGVIMGGGLHLVLSSEPEDAGTSSRDR